MIPSFIFLLPILKNRKEFQTQQRQQRLPKSSKRKVSFHLLNGLFLFVFFPVFEQNLIVSPQIQQETTLSTLKVARRQSCTLSPNKNSSRHSLLCSKTSSVTNVLGLIRRSLLILIAFAELDLSHTFVCDPHFPNVVCACDTLKPKMLILNQLVLTLFAPHDELCCKVIDKAY